MLRWGFYVAIEAMCFLSALFFGGCPDSRFDYDDSNLYEVSPPYSRLFTLCYSLPTEATDTVSSNAAFQLTAVSGSYFRSPGIETKARSLAIVDSSDNRSARFHSALRATESLLSRTPQTTSRRLQARTVTAPPTVGDSRSFYVLNEQNGFVSVSARCVAVTKNTAFWSQIGVPSLTTQQLNFLTTQFEKKIPIVRQKFGTEEDIDGNGLIFVLTASLGEGVFGYFYSVDKMTQSDLDAFYPGSGYRSNEADLFYVNRDFFPKFDDYKVDLAATLVHEMQHMVHFDRRRQAERSTVNSWLNEGLSMLCEYYCGYTSPHYEYIRGAVKSAGISLIGEPDTGAYYGYSLLFLRYLQERFGDEVVKKIYESSYSGVNAVSEATGLEFNRLFAEFCEMMMKTGRGVTNDFRFEIPAFNFKKGTTGYAQNGFCLAEILDEEAARVDLRSYNRVTLNSMNVYAFIPVVWSGATVSAFNFTSSHAELLIGAYSD